MSNFNRLAFLLFACVGFMMSACSKADDDAKPSDPTYPNLDKFQELVDACNTWKSGGGAVAIGGRDAYAVYHITSLEDKRPASPAPGTFRYAVYQSGVRMIVFDTVGTIHLSGPLEIVNGNLSIFGQTAPGDGICLADYPVKIEGASNILIQFMRFRMGDEKLDEETADGADALSINNCTNVLIDHCSMSWSTDECCSCYGNENFTLQYCFITESLRKSKHDKGNHGYGGIWGGKNASFHHNLLAHHDSRNPRFDHDYVTTANVTPVDFINNVVYNWRSNSAYGGEGSSATGNQRQYNFINNYYKPGPATSSGVSARLLNPTTKCGSYKSDGTVKSDGCYVKYGGSIVPGKFYLTGNYMHGSSDVTTNNWNGVFPDESSKKEQCKSTTRFTFANCYTGEETAEQAYTTVLDKAGCSLSRDAIDTRIVTEVEGEALHGDYTYTGSKSGTPGIIDTPSDVGGWPELKGTKPLDTDEDGLPDDWEVKYGLNPYDYYDGMHKSLVSGYSNIEVYAHDLVKHLY